MLLKPSLTIGMKMDWKIPDYIVHDITEHHAMSEYADKFLTNRDPWKELQEKCDWGDGVKVGVGAVSYTHLTLPTNREV